MTSTINELNNAVLDREKVGHDDRLLLSVEDSASNTATNMLLEAMLRVRILSMDNGLFPIHDALLDRNQLQRATTLPLFFFNSIRKH